MPEWRMLDLILREASVEGTAGPVDIAIDGGRITAIGAAFRQAARSEILLGGRLVLPGFVNSHIHLDKTFVGGLAESGIMTDGVAAGRALKRRYTRQDVQTRARRALNLAIRHGTTALRTCADVDPIVGTLCVEALAELRDEYAGRITIQIVAFPQEGVLGVDGMPDMLRRAMKAGADVLGGRPHGDADPQGHVDLLFNLAQELDCPVDMSVDAIFPPDPIDPMALGIARVARKTIEVGFQGRVTVHHVLALSAVAPGPAGEIVSLAKEARLNVITNPTSNLFTEGRADVVNPRRGLTRVKDFLGAGVNVSLGTDNIDDTYLPYVHADPLQEAFLASAAAHLGTRGERRALLGMVTSNGARTLGIDAEYGLAQGKHADLVVLDAATVDEVITHQPEKLYVFKAGRLMASNRRISEFWAGRTAEAGEKGIGRATP
jgi:cytosine deaminase